MEVFHPTELVSLASFSEFLSCLPQYMASKLETCYLSCHKLISHHSQSKIINRIRVVHFTYNLRSHVSGCSTGVLRVVWLNFTWNSQISYSDVASIINNKVLRLQVPMNYLLTVQILKTNNHTTQDKSCFLFFELSSVAQMITKITSIAIVHNQKQIFPVLKGAIDIYQKWIFQLL